MTIIEALPHQLHSLPLERCGERLPGVATGGCRLNDEVARTGASSVGEGYAHDVRAGRLEGSHIGAIGGGADDAGDHQ